MLKIALIMILLCIVSCSEEKAPPQIPTYAGLKISMKSCQDSLIDSIPVKLAKLIKSNEINLMATNGIDCGENAQSHILFRKMFSGKRLRIIRPIEKDGELDKTTKETVIKFLQNSEHEDHKLDNVMGIGKTFSTFKGDKLLVNINTPSLVKSLNEFFKQHGKNPFEIFNAEEIVSMRKIYKNIESMEDKKTLDSSLSLFKEEDPKNYPQIVILLDSEEAYFIIYNQNFSGTIIPGNKEISDKISFYIESDLKTHQIDEKEELKKELEVSIKSMNHRF